VPVYEGNQIDALASLVLPKVQHDSVSVRLETTDNIMLRSSRTASFIKCDIEGAEFSVLKGAESLLGQFHPSLLIEIDQRYQPMVIHVTFDYFSDLGYVGYFIDGCRLRPITKSDVHHHQIRFLDDDFMPYKVPKGYISDFVLLHRHADGEQVNYAGHVGRR